MTPYRAANARIARRFGGFGSESFFAFIHRHTVRSRTPRASASSSVVIDPAFLIFVSIALWSMPGTLLSRPDFVYSLALEIRRRYNMGVPNIDDDLEYRKDVCARLWARVRIGKPEECWLWTGGTAREGYGTANAVGRGEVGIAGAHRIVCWLQYGPPPAMGQKWHAAHTCDVRACCNPAHIRWTTARENMREGWERGGHKSCAWHAGSTGSSDVLAVLRDVRQYAPRVRQKVRCRVARRTMTAPTPRIRDSNTVAGHEERMGRYSKRAEDCGVTHDTMKFGWDDAVGETPCSLFNDVPLPDGLRVRERPCKLVDEATRTAARVVKDPRNRALNEWLRWTAKACPDFFVTQGSQVAL